MSVASSRRVSSAWTYGGLFLFLCLVFLLAVRSGDDFQRIVKFRELSQEQGGLLSSFSMLYESLNGRVLGNALHLFFVDVPVASAVVQALITLGIVWTIARVTRLTYKPAIALLTLLVLAPSVFVFKQVTVWAAGYFNYVPSVLCVLLVVLLLRDGRRWWHYLAALALTFASCLFSENVTAAILLVSAIAFAVSLFKRVDRAKFAGILVVAATGAYTMFSSPVYRRISDGEDTYRQIRSDGDAGGLAALLQRMLENSGPLAEYGALNLSPVYLACGIGIALAVQFWRARLAVYVPTIIMLVGASLLYCLSQFQFKGLQGRNRELTDSVTVLILVLVLAAMLIILLASKRERSLEAAAWVAGGAVLLAPFVIVSPFGPRNMYFTVVCLLVATLMVSAEYLNKCVEVATVGKALVPIFMTLALLMVSSLGINKVVEVRNIKAMAGVSQSDTRLVLQEYPVSAIIQDPYNSDKQRRMIEQCRGLDVPCANLEIIWE